MIHTPEWLDLLQTAPVLDWIANIYRHMFGDNTPDRSNTAGARWNPPGTEAIYTSCERETALAEAEHIISLQPLRPRAKRTLYTVDASLRTVLDLREMTLLEQLGLSSRDLVETDFTACQGVGGAVAWLRYNGLLVPSARRPGGNNLVIYRQNPTTDVFEVVDSEIIEADSR